MTRAIDRDNQRFKEIVRGKVRGNLKKYITHGEVLGKQGSHLDQKFKDCTGSISAVKTSENTDAFDALILAAALSSAEKVGTVVRAVRHPKTGRVTTTTWTACIFDKSDSVSVGQESMMSISFKTGTEPVISTT